MSRESRLAPSPADRNGGALRYGPLEENEYSALAEMISGMRSYSSGEYRLRDTSADYYRWMYRRNPAGPAFAFAAKHGDLLAGAFAMAPKRILIGGRTVLCGKTMEMFTRPEWQGRGIAKQLARMTFDAAREAGIRMWYVTPSKDSYPIFVNRWGYQHSFRIRRVMRVLKPSALLSAAAAFPKLARVAGLPLDAAFRTARRLRRAPAGMDAVEVKTVGLEADALWERCCDYGAAIVRDAVYLNWRYVDNPDAYVILKFRRRGELCGILVLKHSRRRGLDVGEIVDYVCPARETALLEAMLRHGGERLRESGCALVQAWAVEGAEQQRVMKRAGLVFPGKEAVVLLNPDHPYPQIRDGKAWMLAQGDSNDI